MKQEGKDSHEYGLLYDYLDFMTSLYWKKAAPEEIDLNKAEQILDEQHYGLKKVIPAQLLGHFRGHCPQRRGRGPVPSRGRALRQ